MEVLVNNCILCCKDSHETLMKHNIFCENGRIVKCNNCGFIWSNKQLDNYALRDFYKNKYRSLKSEHFNYRRLRDDLQRAISQYDFFWDEISCPVKSVLEIGAGYGVLSKYLHKKGCVNMEVVEPDSVVNNILPDDVNISNNIEGLSSNKFTLIIMSHVLEHVFNVNMYLKELASKMKKNSIIFIEVPNCENAQVYEQSGNSYHYWFFTKKTLIKVFEMSGFEMIKVSAYGKDKFSTKNHQTIMRYVSITLLQMRHIGYVDVLR